MQNKNPTIKASSSQDHISFKEEEKKFSFETEVHLTHLLYSDLIGILKPFKKWYVI